MSGDPIVTALVIRAADGDQGAWNGIVERYAPLVWAICTRNGLTRHDIDDVGQSVWLLLVKNIGTIREPAALPGWLATTTRNECLRARRTSRRNDHVELPPEDQMLPGDAGPSVEDELLAAERDAALRAALAELPRRCRELLLMLVSDPPRSYTEISATLGMAVGSIGPTRARCLERLRQSRHLSCIADGAGWDTEVDEARGEPGD
jgi:RNA polymerase sigma factor (sigma-70 family)